MVNIDDEWLAEKSDNGSQSGTAILQISHRHLDKHLDSKSDQNNNLSSNNTSTLKNKSTTDFCVQVRMDSFINDSLVPTEVPLDQTQQTIENNDNHDNYNDESNSISSTSKPSDDQQLHLQHEMLLLQNELQQYEIKIQTLESENIKHKAEISLFENKMSNSNFTKDKAIEERDEEIEKLIQQSIENEEEIMTLKNENELLDYKCKQLDEFDNMAQELEEKKLLEEELREEVKKLNAMLGAEQKKVSELEEEIIEVESKILELDTTSVNNNNNTSSANILDSSSLDIDLKIKELNEALTLANQATKIKDSRDILQEENVNLRKHVGQLQSKLEHYRLRLSPTQQMSTETNDSSSLMFTNKTEDNFVPAENHHFDNEDEEIDENHQNLVKTYEQQTENLEARLQEQINLENLSKERILALQRDYQMVFDENRRLKFENDNLINCRSEMDTIKSDFTAFRHKSQDEQKNLQSVLAHRDLEIESLNRKLELISNQFTAAVTPPKTSPRVDAYLSPLSPLANLSFERKSLNPSNSDLLDESLQAKLEEQLNDKNQFIEVLRAAKLTLSKQNEELTENNKKLVEEINRLQLEINNSDKKYHHIKTYDEIFEKHKQECGNYQQRIVDLINTIDENNNKIEELEDRNTPYIQELNSRLNRQKEEINNLQNKFNSEENHNHLMEKQRLLDEVSRLTEEVNQQKMTSLAKESVDAETLMKIRNELANTKNDLQDANNKEQLLTTNLKKLNEINEKMELEVRVLTSQKENMEAKLAETNSSAKDLEQEKNDLEQQLQEYEEQAEEIIANELHDKDQEINTLKSYISTLESERRESEQYNSQMSLASKEHFDVQGIKFSIEDLNNKITVKDEEIKNLENVVNNLQDNIQNLRNKMAQYKNKINDLEFEITEKEAEIADLRSPRNPSNQLIVQHKQEIEMLKQRIQSLESSGPLTTPFAPSPATTSSNRDLKILAKELVNKNPELSFNGLLNSYGLNESKTNNNNQTNNNLTLPFDTSTTNFLNGSIQIDGEIPEGLQLLLDAVKNEGVKVVKLSENRSPDNSPRGFYDESVRVELEKLIDVLTEVNKNGFGGVFISFLFVLKISRTDPFPRRRNRKPQISRI